MSIDIVQGLNTPIRLWTPVAEVESSALDQLKLVAALPTIRHLAVMPDVHGGKGCTVGSVIATLGSVSPATVGVDIGCGMAAVRTNLHAKDLPDNLHALRMDIEASIPVAHLGHDGSAVPSKSLLGQKAQRLLWDNLPFLDEGSRPWEKHARTQLGTLGGGNHFIELCLDEEQIVWMVLHSGSRRIGKELAEIHIKIAKALEHNQRLPDPDLSYFLSNTPEMKAYRHDLYWAQEYAALNREIMLDLYKHVMATHFRTVEFETPIMCHHNYVSEEVHFGDHCFVTRKGAIRAMAGDMGIIPGSMGTKSYIVEGLGCEESLNSASHGAGRRMSRGKAKKTFTLDDLAAQTAGVECRKDEGVLDEIPGAYKDVDQVMANQKDLVRIVHTLKAVLCVKG